jgi:membrane protease YdiL (CAAX protease family)
MDETRPNTAGRKKLSRTWSALIGLIVILGSEFILRDAIIAKGASTVQIAIVISIEWVIAFLLLFYWAPKVEGRKLSSLGFDRFRGKYIWICVLVYIGYFVISAGADWGLKTAGMETLRDLSPTLKTYGFPLLLGLFLTGTLVEEVFYRGYIIERVTELSGRRWIGGLVSWFTFTLVHLRFFGLGATLEVGIIAAVLVLLYMRFKSIWPAIIVHGINDVFGFLIGPFLF